MRAQTAIEYLVLLGVTVSIALITIYIINNASETKGDALLLADSVALERMPIGVSAFEATKDGFSLTLVNHLTKRIVINDVLFDDVSINTSFPFSLMPEESVVLTTYDIVVNESGPFSYLLTINYTDTELGISKIQLDTMLPLRGVADNTDYGIDPSEDLAEGLVLLWHGEDASDSSYLGNDGVLYNGATTGAAVIENGFVLDGNDYVNGTVSGLPSGNASRSMSVWFKRAANTTSDPVVGYGKVTGSDNSQFAIFMHESNEIYVDSYYSTTAWIRSGYYINNSQWYHIVATNNVTHTKIFVNGNLVKTQARVYNTTSEIAFVGKGYYGTAAYGNFSGIVDEFAIWNRTLSNDEVRSLYNRGYATLVS